MSVVASKTRQVEMACRATAFRQILLLLAPVAAGCLSTPERAAGSPDAGDATQTIDTGEGALADAAVAEDPMQTGSDAPDALAHPEVPLDDAIPDAALWEGWSLHCGNGFCEKDLGEKAANCQADCCECGDCNSMECGENVDTCPTDCAACGDKQVSPGEGPVCCPTDACRSEKGSGCGDTVCMGKQCGEDPVSCPKDCGTACGNQICDQGENPQICPDDCKKHSCGNRACDFDENPQTCPEDCHQGCGNCECGGDEDYMTCPVDCGYCGDGYCSNCVKESIENCPKDCPKTPGG